MNPATAIAIVGMSCAFPDAPDVPAFWRVAENGSSSFSRIPRDRWNHEAFYSANPRDSEKTYAQKIGSVADIRSFAPECFGIPPRRARMMDPQQRLILHHARLAVEAAGYTGRALPRSTGVYIGASVCEYRSLAISRLHSTQLLGGDWGAKAESEALAKSVVNRVAPIQAYTMVGVLMNMIACNVSDAFNLCGPSLVMDAACSSALLAVHEAVLHLRTGICDAALAGGVYSICTPDMLVGFSRIGALSRSDVCRPFDAGADGFVLGEGTGVVMLKRLEDAWRDGDRVWAVVRGAGLNNDGRGEGPMTPRMDGQLDALSRAYRDAGVSPDTVGYVEAHGTATPVGDKTEIAAIKENARLYADGAVRCAVGSAKGNFGHSLAASGMAGLIRATLALNYKTIPPQAGLLSPREELGLAGSGFSISDKKMPFEARDGLPRRAGVNAFGFGGTNVHLVLEEAPDAPGARAVVSVPERDRPELFIISAMREELLSRHLDDLAQTIETVPETLKDLAYTLTVTRRREAARVAFLASSKKELRERLVAAKALIGGTGDKCSGEICFVKHSAELEQQGTAVTASDLMEKAIHDSDLRAVVELATWKMPLELASLYPGARLASLPSAPVPQRTFWVIQEEGSQPVESTKPEETMRSKVSDAAQSATPEPVAAQSEMVALFARQMSAMREQMEMLSRQAELLGLQMPEAHRAGGIHLPPAESPHTASSARAETPLADVPQSAATEQSRFSSEALLPQFIEMVAHVGSFTPEDIQPQQRLGTDLSFDSLMRMDLYVRLTETFPEARSLPESVLAEDTSIAELVQTIASILEKNAAEIDGLGEERTDDAERESFERYVVALEDAPLANLSAGRQIPIESSVDAPVILIADAGGVAGALAKRLRPVCGTLIVVESTEAAGRWSQGSLIDLSGLDATAAAGGEGMRAGVLRTLERAKALSSRDHAPAAFVLVHRGENEAGQAGVAKALAREWPRSLVRSIELADDVSADAAAGMIYDELFGTDQTVEVSYISGCRRVRRYVLEAASVTPLRDGVVVAITGGGSGLGAGLAVELARLHHARLLLLGRSADAAETVRLVQEAGGEALYVSCDVSNREQVQAAFQIGRSALGPIESVVHAAGILADGPAWMQEMAQAGNVLDTKVAGAHIVWEAASSDPLRSFLMLGSWAGCFGSANQSAYSAANHLLGRLAVQFGEQKTGTHVAVIDLPPWENSGMVNRMHDAARQMLRTRTRLLSDAEGMAHLVAEMSAHGTSCEIVLGSGLEKLGSVDASLWRFSLAEQPWLGDHRVDGRILLPFAVELDHAVSAAMRLGMGPAIQLSSIDVTAPIVVPDTGELHLAVTATGDMVAAEIALTVKNGTGRAVFRAQAQPALEGLPSVQIAGRGAAPQLELAEFYDRCTFHGPRFRGLQSIEEIGPEHAVAVAVAPEDGGPGGAALDVLAVDAMLQLCAYWAAVHLGQIGLPVGADEFRLLRRPAAGETLRIAGRLTGSRGETMGADLDLLDADHRACAQIRGLRCRLTEMRGQPLHTAAMQPAAKSAVNGKVAHAGGDGKNGNRNGHSSTNPNTTEWQLESLSEIQSLEQRMEFAHAAGLKDPYFPVHQGVANQTSRIGGQEYLNFASYNYLGLSGDAEVTAATIDAVQRYGTSVSASRLASGERPLHGELEREIAEWLGCEDAIAMVGGHATNVGVIGHLFGPQDMVIHDSLAHDSILGGIRLSGAKRLPFPHNDPAALDEILKRVRGSARRVLIAVEGVYSMDGDVARLAEIVEVKQRHKAILFVDEAHSLGVLGKTGRGVGEHSGIDPRDVELWMGTLSKSLASCGGYIAGSARLVRYLKYSNPSFVYSVGLSPANAAAALAALHKLRAHPELVATLRSRGQLFLDLCRVNGIDTGLSDGTSVIPCIVGNSMQCLRLSEALAGRKINVQPILYPAVEEHLSRLRFFITAGHTEQQIRTTVEILTEELQKLRISPAKGVEAMGVADRGVGA